MNRENGLAARKGAGMFAMAAVMAAGLTAGCKPQGDAYSYDPKVDSVVPPAISSVDMSILEDQKTRPRPVVDVPAAAPTGRGGAATAPAGGAAPGPETPATPGTAAAPTAPTAPGTTPPPPPVNE